MVYDLATLSCLVAKIIVVAKIIDILVAHSKITPNSVEI